MALARGGLSPTGGDTAGQRHGDPRTAELGLETQQPHASRTRDATG